jgi:putative outer membrane protein
MKNKILIAAFAAAACVSVGSSEGLLLGIEGDYSFKSSLTAKWSEDGDSGTVKDHKGQAAIGFKAGYDFGIARAYGEYMYDFKVTKNGSDEDEDFKHSWNKHSLLVGGDFTPEITNSFRLVAGAYTGVSFLKYKDSYNDFSGDSDSISKTVPGWVIGARLGGLYSFDEHNEIEFGYKADYTRYKASKLGEDIDKAYETNHGLYLGYNFKF